MLLSNQGSLTGCITFKWEVVVVKGQLKKENLAFVSIQAVCFIYIQFMKYTRYDIIKILDAKMH